MLIDFSPYVNLPWIWAAVIAIAIFLYVLLDGFVLGVGILFPFTMNDRDRDRLMNSIAPFWDANQTWLVMGGGGMLAAFPLAYSVLFAAFYIPLIAMLLCLIFRGAAFEFRYKEHSPKRRLIWTYFFHFGSVGAAFFQGTILGAFIEGVTVEGRSFSGGSMDWATSFSMVMGMGLVFGYGLLGATWSVLKTEGLLQKWSRNVALYCMNYIVIFLIALGIFMPIVQPRLASLWFEGAGLYVFLSLSALIGYIVTKIYACLWKECDKSPFVYTIVLFLLSYAQLLWSIAPWIVPFHFTIEQACAAKESLSLMLIGVIFVLPCILAYTAYTYWVFWGKASESDLKPY